MSKTITRIEITEDAPDPAPTLGREKILQILVDEAFKDLHTGWLSDLWRFTPVYVEGDEAIDVETDVPTAGSIDVGQLADLIQGLINQAVTAATTPKENAS